MTLKPTCIGNHVFEFASAKFTVVVRFIKLEHIEINRAVLNIGEAFLNDLLNDFDLFNNVSGCGRFDAWGQQVELL